MAVLPLEKVDGTWQAFGKPQGNQPAVLCYRAGADGQRFFILFDRLLRNEPEIQSTLRRKLLQELYLLRIFNPWALLGPRVTISALPPELSIEQVELPD